MYSPDTRAGVMTFLVYFFVLLVAASSVLFGLDWMQAPLQAPVSGGHTTYAASASAPQTTVRPSAAPSATATKPVSIAVTPSSAAETTASAAALANAPALPAGNDAAKAQATDGMKTDAMDVKPAPLCDIAACERAYHTFTPADCTYKPYEGPRRLCTRGNPPRRPSALLAANQARAQVSCNVSACASAYESFDAATCTYQPFDGPRRLCTK